MLILHYIIYMSFRELDVRINLWIANDHGLYAPWHRRPFHLINGLYFPLITHIQARAPTSFDLSLGTTVALST
jgi:hypothetical protein